MLKNKIVRVRWLKRYPTAHNHVAIGTVIDETDNYLVLLCKTYHFGDSVGGRQAKMAKGRYVNGILESGKATRIIPWHCIEIMHELPPATDWEANAYTDETGLCYLNNRQKTVITRLPELDN
jgi:hypothetical protein